ncbi:50S ribosomal protein L11 methyltransferase, partial [bacterium]|nr:50S ribosomal protein L11 methyltransferase [bacterium]
MDYTTIKIETSLNDSCITEEFLYLAGISGWLEEENGDRKTITFYLPQDESGELKLKIISEGIKNIDSKTNKTILKAEDWENDWKKNFKAIKIGKIIITPPWENPKAENGEKIITIEPG